MSNSNSEKRKLIYIFYNEYINSITSLLSQLKTNRSNDYKIREDFKSLLQEKYDDKKLSDKEFVFYLKDDFQKEFVKLYDFLYKLLSDLCNKIENNIELQELERKYKNKKDIFNKKSFNLEQQLTQKFEQYPRNPYPRHSSYGRRFGGGQNNNLSLLQLKDKIDREKKRLSEEYSQIMYLLKNNIVVFIEFNKYLGNKKLPCFNNYQYLFPIESNSNVLDVYFKYLQSSKNQENRDVKRYVNTQNLMKEIELGTDSYYSKSNLNKKLNSKSNSEVLNSNKLRNSNIQSIYEYMNTYKDFKRLLTKEDILIFENILKDNQKFNITELKKYINDLIDEYNKKIKSLNYKLKYTYIDKKKIKTLKDYINDYETLIDFLKRLEKKIYNKENYNKIKNKRSNKKKKKRFF